MKLWEIIKLACPVETLVVLCREKHFVFYLLKMICIFSLTAKLAQVRGHLQKNFPHAKATLCTILYDFCRHESWCMTAQAFVTHSGLQQMQYLSYCLSLDTWLIYSSTHSKTTYWWLVYSSTLFYMIDIQQ